MGQADGHVRVVLARRGDELHIEASRCNDGQGGTYKLTNLAAALTT